MSLNTTLINPIEPTMKQNWTDLNKDGRRMDHVIKICFKEFKKTGNDFDMRMSYVDRMIKATVTKQSLAITVLGVKKSLEDARKR